MEERAGEDEIGGKRGLNMCKKRDGVYVDALLPKRAVEESRMKERVGEDEIGEKRG